MTSDPATSDPQGSPFWTFSLAVYRDQEVAQACLDLQDTHEVDVNLLLFLLWLASTRRTLSEDGLRALDRRLDPWRAEVVVPLRAMRRRLKSDAPLLAAAAAEAFRTRVKALELESERLQQEAMFALAGGLATATVASVEAASRANIAAYESLKGRAFKQGAVETLVRAASAR